MYVFIGSKMYTEIKNLTFAPETDILNNTLPIAEVQFDVVTDDVILPGQFMQLRDEITASPDWTYYYVIYAERLESASVTIRAQSQLRLTDYAICSASLYDGTYRAVDALNVALTAAGLSGLWRVDPSFDSITLSGYAPEQTARERIQWLCFVLQAYVRSCGSNSIEILPIDDSTAKIIPVEKTFWRPVISHSDYVESVSIKSYAFTKGTPTAHDKTIEYAGDTYIVSEQTHTLTNPNIPVGVKGEHVVFDDVMLVNSDNWSDILSYLATLYFNRTELDADIINNGVEFNLGERVQMYLDEETMVSGFIESLDFSFGVQARARVHLNGVEELSSAKLIITYLHEDTKLAKRRYRFPIGYEYSIENPYLDKISSKHRYVYRPLNEFAEGTIASGTNTNNQQCEVALHFTYDDDTLLLISVSGVEEEGTSEVIAIE